jgi:hypothetical protein
MKRSFASLAVIIAAAMVLSASSRALAAAKPDFRKDPTHEARRVVAVVADRALQKDALNKILEVLSKPDRERIEKQISKKDDQEYQKLADQVHKIWKDKYGHDFDAEVNVDNLKDLKVRFTGEGKDQKGFVELPAEPGEAAYEIRLVRDPDNNFWRIELPDSFDGNHFYDSLKASLQRVIAEKDRLPGADNKAYERVVAWIDHEMAFPSASSAKK